MWMMPALNWGAIAIASVVQLVLGMLWYSPVLFGKRWMKLAKVKMKKGENMGPQMAIAFVAGLVMAAVMSHALMSLRVVSVLGAGCFAACAWLGFVVPTQVSSVLWAKKPLGLFAIDVFYWLVAMKLMAIILVSWR